MRSLLLAAALLALAPLHLSADLASSAAALGGQITDPGTATIKGNKTIDAATFAKLCAEPALTTLIVNGSKMTPETVAALTQSKSLKALDLGHSMVNRTPDLQTIARLSSLESLNLGGSDFGDEGLAAIAPLKNIRALMLGHVGRSDKTAFTANGLKALATMPKLEEVTLHIHRYDPAMIDALKSVKTLKTLTIGGLTKGQFDEVKTALGGVTVKARGKLTAD